MKKKVERKKGGTGVVDDKGEEADDVRVGGDPLDPRVVGAAQLLPPPPSRVVDDGRHIIRVVTVLGRRIALATSRLFPALKK
jgi:hypothetical protein